MLVFALPIGIIKFETLKKNYHLKNYAARTKPINFMLEDNWLTVNYIADGKEFTQSVSLGDKTEEFKESHYSRSDLVIRYSTKNPKIIEIEAIK